MEVEALARVNPLLAEATELLWWCTRYANIKLSNFCRSDIASVGDGAVHRCDDIPKCGQASWSDCAVGSGVCRADIAEKLSLQGGIVESGVCQPISKLKARGNVLRNESLVVDVHALGEVGLGIVFTSVIRNSWVEQRAIVGSLLCDGVWKTARWGLLAVHDLHQRLSAVLTRKMGVYDSGDIRIIDPGVNDSDASVMDDDNSVVALRCNILDKNIRVLIGKYISVPTFSGELIDEDDARVASFVDNRILGQEIPGEPGAVLLSLSLEGVIGRVDISRVVRATTCAIPHCASLDVVNIWQLQDDLHVPL